jgi:hypothetical protein
MFKGSREEVRVKADIRTSDVSVAWEIIERGIRPLGEDVGLEVEEGGEVRGVWEGLDTSVRRDEA